MSQQHSHSLFQLRQCLLKQLLACQKHQLPGPHLHLHLRLRRLHQHQQLHLCLHVHSHLLLQLCQHQKLKLSQFQHAQRRQSSLQHQLLQHPVVCQMPQRLLHPVSPRQLIQALNKPQQKQPQRPRQQRLSLLHKLLHNPLLQQVPQVPPAVNLQCQQQLQLRSQWEVC